MPQKARIDRRRLYQQVADDIERMILDGTFPPDTRLPGEHELAEQYDVSRNVIREALKRLKEHGLVVIKTGSGTYVRVPSTKPVSDALQRLLRHSANNVPFTYFYEIRRMIEPESARLAAERANEDDTQEIRSALQRMEENRTDSDAWSNADLDFHLAIAQAAKNPLIYSILLPLTDPFRQVIAAGHLDPQGTEAGLMAHNLIVDAIVGGDSEQAYQAMLNHLVDSEERLTKLGFNPTK